VKENNDFIRVFMAGVRSVELDTTGRMQIPKDLVKYAGISKNLVVSSSINRMEIWDKDIYEEVLDSPEVDFGVLAEKVMGNKAPDNE
jgi:MraZ protein